MVQFLPGADKETVSVTERMRVIWPGSQNVLQRFQKHSLQSVPTKAANKLVNQENLLNERGSMTLHFPPVPVCNIFHCDLFNEY